MDMIEIDAASNRGIDEIRQLKEKINYQPVKGRKKIYIIDEVHMLTKEAFNALLKTLEEPPEHVIFILATTEADKILPTIISRCQRYDFKALSMEEMTNKLKYICEQENINIDDEVFEIIYENSGGSMRDSISILERLMVTCFDEKITFEKCEQVLGITPTKQMEDFLNKIQQRNYIELVKTLDEYWNDSVEIESFFKDFAKFCKNLMSKNKLDIKEGLKIIDSIFTSLNIFKYEEDKRLVGYVIVDNLLKEHEPVTEKIIEKVIEKPVSTKINNTENIVQATNTLSLDEVLRNWELILKEAKKEKITLGAFLIAAKPYKMENNTLYIGFTPESSFCKEQMENKIYHEVFLEVVKRIISPEIKIKYIIIGKKKATEDENSDFTKKIVDFFGGEIIE